jgi:hypothetical protein
MTKSSSRKGVRLRKNRKLTAARIFAFPVPETGIPRVSFMEIDELNNLFAYTEPLQPLLPITKFPNPNLLFSDTICILLI